MYQQLQPAGVLPLALLVTLIVLLAVFVMTMRFAELGVTRMPLAVVTHNAKPALFVLI